MPNATKALAESIAEAATSWTGVAWPMGTAWDMEGSAEDVRAQAAIDRPVIQADLKELNRKLSVAHQSQAAAVEADDRELYETLDSCILAANREVHDVKVELAAIDGAVDYAERVEASALEAAAEGERAIAHLAAGRILDARASLAECCRIEEEYGDSPIWSEPQGRLETMLGPAE